MGRGMEAEAVRAEAVGRDLLLRAHALFEWSFEARHTDPHPDTLAGTAAALEAHARELRALDAGRPR